MLINNMRDQMEYQILKEKYMRYHRLVGAKNALDAFDLPEEFMPADEFKYTHEEITADEEIRFYSWPERYLGRQEEIIGAIEVLRAAMVSDEIIVKYIVAQWGISENYARNHMEDVGTFAERVGMLI